jgi:hypothetical protein
MKLLFIHGKPAVGKLTVARIVAQRTGGRLFHNHLAVNLALAVFPFGSPAFVAVREEVWLKVFRTAAAEGVPLLIFTFNPEDTVPQAFVDQLFAEMAEAGVDVIPVELTATEDDIERRLGSDARKREGKLLDAEAYRRLRDEGAFSTPVIPGNRLSLDTGALGPEEAAALITALV